MTTSLMTSQTSMRPVKVETSRRTLDRLEVAPVERKRRGIEQLEPVGGELFFVLLLVGVADKIKSNIGERKGVPGLLDTYFGVGQWRAIVRGHPDGSIAAAVREIPGSRHSAR